VRGPSLRLPRGTLREGSYWWSASPIDDGGNELEQPRRHELSIVNDVSPTALTISAPLAGHRLHGSQVRVEGVAPPSSKLYVNGQRATLDGGGRFKLRVASRDGVVFRLVDAEGKERFWVRGLRRVPR
jgi:hypothetical protein